MFYILLVVDTLRHTGGGARVNIDSIRTVCVIRNRKLGWDRVLVRHSGSSTGNTTRAGRSDC